MVKSTRRKKKPAILVVVEEAAKKIVDIGGIKHLPVELVLLN
jgi:hypothetical protein